MPTLAEVIDALVGIDTHRDVHVAELPSPTGAPLATVQIPNTSAGYAELLGWITEHSPGSRRATVQRATYRPPTPLREPAGTTRDVDQKPFISTGHDCLPTTAFAGLSRGVRQRVPESDGVIHRLRLACEPRDRVAAHRSMPRAEGVAVAREAVDLYRELARDDPDRYRSDVERTERLAASLAADAQ